MEIDPNQIEPGTGQVVIKYEQQDRGWIMPQMYSPELYTNVFGEVVTYSKDINFDKENPAGEMWLPQVDIQIGNRVCFGYLEAVLALQEKAHEVGEDMDRRYFTWHGELYLVLNYTSLYFKEAPIVPLNGYVIVEPLELTSVGDKVQSMTAGLVKYAGLKNLEYLTSHEDSDVGVGEYVVYKNTSGLRMVPEGVEHEISEFQAVQRKDVMAVVDKEVAMNNRGD